MKVNVLVNIKSSSRFREYRKHHVSVREAAKACLQDLEELKTRPCYWDDKSIVLPRLDKIIRAMGGNVKPENGQMTLFSGE